jgi:Flp pilus assembly protein TadG
LRFHSKKRGYILVALSLGLVFLLGMAGMAIDIGRMYITKSEAQSFADTAAFAAALELDGTAAGIARAQTAVANDPKKWVFQNDAFTNVQTAFSTTPTGPFTAAPPTRRCQPSPCGLNRTLIPPRPITPHILP